MSLSDINKIKLLIADDSAFMRAAIERMVADDVSIQVIGSADNGKEAVEKALRLKPDVITMDVEMPIIDGLRALKEIMRACPTPVLMVSSFTTEGAKITLEALELGAVDYLPKPGSGVFSGVLSLKNELITKIHAAYQSKPSPMKLDFSAAKKLKRHASSTADSNVSCAVFIGASTGGPPALQKILSLLDSSFPAPIVIAQHMPSAFTAAFASRLNSVCAIRVKEANHGEILQNCFAYICPGGSQTRVVKTASGLYAFDIMPSRAEADSFAPCINTLFFSAAKEFSNKAIGVLLTGMGQDGVRGLKNIKLMGGLTIAQDRASSVVYGMPRAALEQKACERILNIEEIAHELSIAISIL